MNFFDPETDIRLPLHSSILLFIGMGKKWRKVICVMKLSHGTTTKYKTRNFSNLGSINKKLLSHLTEFSC